MEACKSNTFVRHTFRRVRLLGRSVCATASQKQWRTSLAATAALLLRSNGTRSITGTRPWQQVYNGGFRVMMEVK